MNLSKNYYYRQCYLKEDQVPTQSVMRNTMSPALAKVYFKTMTPKQRAFAGLEPPLRGGGSNWLISPKDLLEGKTIMKPVKKECLVKLGFNGIALYGQRVEDNNRKKRKIEVAKVLTEKDRNWKITIATRNRQQWDKLAREAAEKNTHKVLDAFQQFRVLLDTSINKLQVLLLKETAKEIIRVREEAIKKMQVKYQMLRKQQVEKICNEYTELLATQKAKLKSKFIENLEQSRTRMGDQLHDLNYEKHVAIEKLRHVLECQNIACQVYVALKEREECEKELDASKYKHQKNVQALKKEMAMKDYEITLAAEKEKKIQQYISIWQKKVCEVVKKFQMFVAYSLNSIPEQAEFFLNVEKLLMLQLNEASDNPNAESLFVPEIDEFHTPISQPRPFFLFCDKGCKPNLEQNLCLKQCTSNASQFPVIVINKKGIYAACDNIEMFADKVTQYVEGRLRTDKDFADEHDYSKNMPVKYTSSQRLQELKLQSSLFQMLQSEMPNLKQLPTESDVVKIPYAVYSGPDAPKIPMNPEIFRKGSLASLSSFKSATHEIELMHEREPNWDSYMKYLLPKKCKCSKMAKKHLEEYLPPYMRQKSTFAATGLPHYEPCSVAELRKLVKKAQGKRAPLKEIELNLPKTRNASTQYIEPDFDFLCTCFSDEVVENFLDAHNIKGLQMFATSDTITRPHFMPSSVTPSYMVKSASLFATERAMSLKNLIREAPVLEEIFKNIDCEFM